MPDLLSELDPPVVEAPSRPASASVIWLHGLGADGNDFVPIVPHLGPVVAYTRFVFPHAPLMPVTINRGMVMRAWYDIGERDGRLQADEGGIRRAQRLLEAMIAAEHGRGIGYERILVAGFSQGGAIALQTALRYPQRLAGIAALSTYLPLAETLAGERSAANRDVPVFMAHGRSDPLIPIPLAESSRDALGRLGYPVEWHAYAMAHAVCPEEIADLGRWLQDVVPPLPERL